MLLPFAAVAQTPEQDRGYLQALLEDNLSDAGRQVRIIGFAGALSSKATVDEITIADDKGIWITLHGVTLDWNRAALLGGRLEISELSADEIDLPRAPAVAEDAGPTPEASGFSLPDLPVSVDIGTIKAGKVSLGEALFGAAAVISLDGTARLKDGAGTARLDVRRIDGTEGALKLTGSYSNATRYLDLTLDVSEPADGIAANLIGLPGRPSLDLSVKGAGPLDDFAADIRLASDGEPRLEGQVRLTGRGGDTEPPDPAETATGYRTFTADLGGDIAPLFWPEYRGFFGDDIRLAMNGARYGDGRLRLDSLTLKTSAMRLAGQMTLSADGWPEAFALTGEIADTDGKAVLLPLAGEKTWIDAARLELGYDRSAGDGWTAGFNVTKLARATLTIDQLRLTGSGKLEPGDGIAIGRLGGSATYAALGLTPRDPGLARALGPQLTGGMQFEWVEAAPLRLSDFVLSGEDYGLSGDISVTGLREGLNPQAKGLIRLMARDLRRFSGLAGTPLEGAVSLEAVGSVTPFSGVFDLAIEGEGTELRLSQPRIDPLLEGKSRLDILARRNESGLTIDRFTLSNDHLSAELEGKLSSEGSVLELEAAIAETGRISHQLSGPATLKGIARQAGPGWTLDFDATGPGGARVSTEATLTVEENSVQRVEGTFEAEIQSLAPYSGLAGQRLAGATQLSGEGWLEPRDGFFMAKLAGSTQDLDLSQPRIDPLLEGQSRFELLARRNASGVLLDRVILRNDHLRAEIEGRLSGDGNLLVLDAAITDMARVSPQLTGPATLEGTVSEAGSGWKLDLNATGPGGARASTEATLTVEENVVQRVEGTLEAEVQSLAPYSGLAGQALSGAARFSGAGRIDPRDGGFEAEIAGETQDLGLSSALADPLLRGKGTVRTRLRRGSDGVLVVERLDAATPQARASVTGRSEEDRTTLQIEARLSDLGLVAPGVSGAAQAEGTAALVGDRWRLDLQGSGPGGTVARVSGHVAANGSDADLEISGRAPLALANAYMAPNQMGGEADYDLRLDGPLRLSSLSGLVRTGAGRLFVPEQRLRIAPLSGTLRLSGGRAMLQARGTLSSGGEANIAGEIGLAAPNTADLEVNLVNAGISDGALYDTSLSGQIGFRGPLSGGGLVRGDLTLGETEIRITEAAPAIPEALEEIRHVNEPADVRRTRSRAGLIEEAGESGPRKVHTLDLLLRAPARIFVRGRGLDAELGGQLRLGGTTRDVVPRGRFDLIRGRLEILGQRLTLSEGQVRLRGAFDPYLYLVATTQADDVEVRIIVEGLASDPKITFSSSPGLPEDEVLARLLFGRNLTEISPLQAVQLAAAVQTLAGGDAGVLDRLRQNFGLDDLDIRSDETGATQATVGKYISEKVYTDVTVGSDGKSEINLNIQISPSVTGRGSVGSDGNSSLGIFFERDY